MSVMIAWFLLHYYMIIRCVAEMPGQHVTDVGNVTKTIIKRRVFERFVINWGKVRYLFPDTERTLTGVEKPLFYNGFTLLHTVLLSRKLVRTTCHERRKYYKPIIKQKDFGSFGVGMGTNKNRIPMKCASKTYPCPRKCPRTLTDPKIITLQWFWTHFCGANITTTILQEKCTRRHWIQHLLTFAPNKQKKDT